MIRPCKKALLAVLIVISWPMDALAQDPTGPQARRISLEEALRIHEQSNLDLKLARQRLRMAEARQVSAGVFPTPLITGSREQLSGRGETYHETVLTLGQTVEIGGQRGLRREAASAGTAAAVASVDAERLRLAFQVHRAYVRAAAAEANLILLREATSVFRQVGESGQARFVEGDISRFDRDRLQMERTRYEILLARAGLDLDEAARDLTLLVDPESVSRPGLLLPAAPLASMADIDREMALAAALAAAAERAEVRAAAAEVQAARVSLSLAQRERIPDLTVTGGYKHQADGFQGAVIGLSLPLPMWNRNRGEIAEAQAAVDVAIARQAVVLRSAENEIRRAWEVRNSLQQRSRLIGESLLPESAGILETARVAYAEGEMSLIELLDAADAYRSARQAINELLAESLIATYELGRATGRLLTPPSIADSASAR